MKEVVCETYVEISADLYHALRFDKSFSAFCAADENATFVQISEEDAADEHGEALMFAESALNYGKGAVPAFVQRALGTAQDIEVRSRLRYWTALFDQEHPLTFETKTNVLAGRLSTTGASWLEPVSPTSCYIHNTVSIEIRMFPVGPLLEGFAAARVSQALNRLPAVIERYLGTSECHAFVSSYDASLLAQLPPVLADSHGSPPTRVERSPLDGRRHLPQEKRNQGFGRQQSPPRGPLRQRSPGRSQTAGQQQSPGRSGERPTAAERTLVRSQSSGRTAIGAGLELGKVTVERALERFSGGGDRESRRVSSLGEETGGASDEGAAGVREGSHVEEALGGSARAQRVRSKSFNRRGADKGRACGQEGGCHEGLGWGQSTYTQVHTYSRTRVHVHTRRDTLRHAQRTPRTLLRHSARLAPFCATASPPAHPLAGSAVPSREEHAAWQEHRSASPVPSRAAMGLRAAGRAMSQRTRATRAAVVKATGRKVTAVRATAAAGRSFGRAPPPCVGPSEVKGGVRRRAHRIGRSRLVAWTRATQ